MSAGPSGHTEQEGHEPEGGWGADLEAAARFVREGRAFVVSGHRGPDGDSIGSVLAMAGILELLGKQVIRYSCDPVPYPYVFLSQADRFSSELPGGEEWRVVLLDCSHPDRAGVHLQRFARGRPLLVIDHHLNSERTAEACVCDPQAAAVGVLVERVAAVLGVPLNQAIAEAIYTTVVSDTGSFHYSNTSPDALRCCARMLELGVDPWRVASHLYEAEPLVRMKLLGEVLDTLEVSPDGQCATLMVSREMMNRHRADDDLLDGFINYGRRVQGVEIAVMFREIRPDFYKCSMRSRGRVNVAEIAARFGGGGHHNAAGCHVPRTYPEARRIILEAVEQELARCTVS